jgi:chemotaxis protein CheX
METVIIDALGASVLESLSVMTMTSVVKGVPRKGADLKIRGEVVGIIGLSGPNSSGVLIISFEQSSIFEMLENMLGERYSTLSAEVLDAIGEMTNIVCGDLKRRLSELGYQISMASPTVVRGADAQLSQENRSEFISIPFSTSSGRFVVETNLCCTS